MQFLFGSIATILGMAVFYLIMNKDKAPKTKHFGVSQSYIYNLILPAIPILNVLSKYNKKDSQSMLFEKKMTVKVIIVDNEAYWIKDNKVFSAEMQGNNIDNNSTKVVDTMGMDDVQLKKIMFIIDKLTEGSNGNDSGNTSYPKF